MMNMEWRRGKRIGSGSFGFVSLATLESRSSDSNGLKLIPLLMAAKSAEVSRSSSLQKEMIVLQLLEDCPQVVRCFGSDVTQENGSELFNIFLEYACGGSLANRIQSLRRMGSVMGEAEVKQHTKTLLIGLASIHNHGYVHCDMKPHNILIMDNDNLEIKIADFGLAKRVGERIKASTSAVLGTPLYVAPESGKQDYEPPFDVWGLGCTVLEMVTGQPPWEIDEYTNLYSILYKIVCTDKIPDIPSWVSEEAKDFLGKCFVKDPKSRWTVDMLLDHPFVRPSTAAQNQHDTVLEKSPKTVQEEDIGVRRRPFKICWKVHRPGEAFGRRNAIPLLGC